MSNEITPRELADQTLASLEQLADPNSARRFQRFFKPHETVHVYGIKTPKIREVERTLYGKVKKAWSYVEALEFCNLLIAQKFHEGKIVAILLLSRWQESFETSLLNRVEGWLTNGDCSNWAAIDALSLSIVAPLIERFPELVSQICSWASSDNMWKRRVALVSFVSLVRKGECLDVAYQLSEQLFDDREDLIHKATGWLLREAGKTDSNRLERYILKHGSKMPRTALRYAIEKFPKERHQELLMKTR
ncbi:DNA alkylation repair protein [candidate division KSB1 bacterium]|nr:DNA alkylation repair protein [candidate division KSB1 bacterium]NIR69295.1 DNA alkylation repair protein [candidate division KSB1 bacterium]NIS22690.1 DNA alkylation repair protein [candidate division KSB1 bacterium]NIT69538.1 DNA alkylation repair protein [candidate division KSB1 bacterium]NIU23192.1 DNA alkylation repair protein [candidate division KSB1 bacterium]